MTGNGPGGTLPVLKSNGDLVGMTRSANSPHSQHTSAGDLLGLEASTCSGASASSGSLSSQQQGAEAFMSPSGFVHAKGEHVSMVPGLRYGKLGAVVARQYFGCKRKPGPGPGPGQRQEVLRLALSLLRGRDIPTLRHFCSRFANYTTTQLIHAVPWL
jgi:hypothetical protein